ncbi:hypothetical protein DK847_14690 [Aestuariivirga litoralis]|uniref:Rap1a immunity protein domain-containing protein n=1 Tax=Aestuariivirga litoralis TaxID=2650924 RepID=A0A2W2BJP8_9HYPH|nr:Rap1a/Tai family immunity protein [Aestuariivirga litoralis]PZF76419.1 hypothetical protein DK847_14690 [Aestuariivirga litoralis]
MSVKVLRLSVSALSLFTVAAISDGALARHTDHILASQLYNLCTNTIRQGGGGGDRIEAGSCLGYIVGIADTFDCEEADHGFHWDPEKAGGSQVQLVVTVMQWIDTHKLAPQQEAHMVVGQALQEAYPCDK